VVALGCVWTGLLLFQGVPNVYAQLTINASLSGSVLDKTSAAVPGASVTLSNPDKGLTRTFTTTTDGRYVFTLIPAGNYTLKVEKSGFRTYVQRGILLAVGEAASQDVSLELGTVTQEVQVTAAAPLLNTVNANVSSEVTGRTAVELPLSWRNVYQFTILDSSVQDANVHQVAGVGTNAGNAEQDGVLLNFGGGRFGTTAFLLDGHWDGAGDWDALMYAPSVDELQEFKIQSYTFTAQYGWSTGNYVNAVTKSGTSKFHGNVYEFLRNSALDANNFFNNANNVAKTLFHRNQYGFTVGGPLDIPHVYSQKDKTFVFGSFEALRQQTPMTLVTNVPTTDFRTGDFSALLGSQISADDGLGRPVLSGQIYNPFTTRTITAGHLDPTTGRMATRTGYIRDPFAGNVLTSGLLDGVAKNLLQYWPAPTNDELSNNYANAASLPVKSTRYTVRVDHNISDKSTFFARWSREWNVRQISGEFFGPDDPGGPGNKTPNDRWDTGLNYTRVFSPTLVMSINGGWNRWVEVFHPQSEGFKSSTLGFPAGMDVVDIFPHVAPTGIFGLNGGLNGSQKSRAPRETRTIAVDFTKVHGAHSMSAGFMGLILPVYDSGMGPATFGFSSAMTSGPDPTSGNPLTGFGFASFLLGTGDSGGGITTTAASAFMKKMYGWYFQDDWKATRKLTVNLGLRYDFQTAPTERYDRITRFEFSQPNPIAQAVGLTLPGQLVYTGGGTSRGVYKPQYTNFAPRVGLAYQLTNKLVARAGFGMFYIPAIEMSDYQGLPLYGYTQTTPWVATLDGITPVNLLSDPFPNGLIQAVGKAAGGLTNVGLDTQAMEPTRPTPYVEQWSLGLEYALTPNDKLDVTYIGNHGVKLPFYYTVKDQLPDSALALGTALFDPVTNPFYGHIQVSGCGLDQPTVLRGFLLRPLSQYCSVLDMQPPGGFSTYHAARINYTHRWSSGLYMLASFTVSKFLDDSSGVEGWATRGAIAPLNNNNLAAEKSLDFNDIPKSLVVSYIYELPFGRGKKFGSGMNAVANGILGGWQVSGITMFKSGFPLAIGDLINNTYSFGGAQRPNLVGDPHVSQPTINKWFNTAAFAQPASFTFGNGPRTMPNLRCAGQNNWDLAIQKWWGLHKEDVRMQFRAEFFNAFNHPYFFSPDVWFGSPTFGQVSQAGLARSIQLGLKIYW
jgi:hypothetical protein